MMKGCIIVYEYSYFCLQAEGNPHDVIAIAVKQYEDSGTQANVFHSLQQVLQQHDNASVTVEKLIFDIILRNRMCQSLVFNNIQSNFVIANRFK